MDQWDTERVSELSRRASKTLTIADVDEVIATVRELAKVGCWIPGRVLDTVQTRLDARAK